MNTHTEDTTEDRPFPWRGFVRYLALATAFIVAGLTVVNLVFVFTDGALDPTGLALGFVIGWVFSLVFRELAGHWKLQDLEDLRRFDR